MDNGPTWKFSFVNLAIAILLAPLALAFMIAAALAAGPSNAFKAMTGRK